MQGIGVDADQGYLGAHIITSALKKVDVAVFDTVKAVQDGSFKGGDGHDLRRQVGRRRPRQALRRGLRSTRSRSTRSMEQIKSGEITDIPTEVK